VKKVAFVALFGSLSLVGCSSSSSGGGDGGDGTDSAADDGGMSMPGTSDATLDAAPEATVDAPSDASSDAMSEASSADAGSADGSVDAMADGSTAEAAVPEASADVSVDAPVDALVDVMADTSTAEAGGPEASVDAPVDAPADVYIDSYVAPPSCINDGNPHFQFLHNPNGLDYNAGIVTGIPAATTPAPGDSFNAKIIVDNLGDVPGNAEVALCVIPSGSNVTTFIDCQVLAGSNLDPCDALNPGNASTFTMPWTVPSGYSKFSLVAMVRDTALGAPGYDSPINTANNHFTVAFNPANAASAEFDVTLTPGGGAP
jgi:hypothetical protein